MMTFDEVFEQLTVIDTAAVPLLKAAGPCLEEDLWGQLCSSANPAQDSFLRQQTGNLLEALAFFHAELCYLKTPVSGEYQLERFPNGRYGFFDRTGHLHLLSCGTSIETKLHDSQGRPYWVKSRIEHNGSDYFLWERPDIPLLGLNIREREVAGYDF